MSIARRPGVLRSWLLALAAYALALHPAAMAAMPHGAEPASVVLQADAPHGGHDHGTGSNAQPEQECCGPTGCPIALPPSLPDCGFIAAASVAPVVRVTSRPISHLPVGFEARGPPLA